MNERNIRTITRIQISIALLCFFTSASSRTRCAPRRLKAFFGIKSCCINYSINNKERHRGLTKDAKFGCHTEQQRATFYVYLSAKREKGGGKRRRRERMKGNSLFQSLCEWSKLARGCTSAHRFERTNGETDRRKEEERGRIERQ